MAYSFTINPCVWRTAHGILSLFDSQVVLSAEDK